MIQQIAGSRTLPLQPMRRQLVLTIIIESIQYLALTECNPSPVPFRYFFHWISLWQIIIQNSQLVELLASEHEIPAKVFFPYHRILRKHFTRALEKNLTVEQKISPVGNRQRLRCIMVSYQNAYIFSFSL